MLMKRDEKLVFEVFKRNYTESECKTIMDDVNAQYPSEKYTIEVFKSKEIFRVTVTEYNSVVGSPVVEMMPL